MPDIKVGPDAYRYLCAAEGVPVPRPFNLRWLLPAVCGLHRHRWWVVWLVSWPLLAAGTFWWQHNVGASVFAALAAAGLLLGLPGILGPQIVVPVGVDLPATALAVISAAMVTNGGWWIAAGVPVGLLAASIKETSPVVAALCCWSLWPLLALVTVVARYVIVGRRDKAPDPAGAQFQGVTDHPIRSAFAAHRGQWRDGWVMVAPWGVCLVALREPGWPVIVALAVAYAQLLIATDTVRLLHHVAGPVMAAAAVRNLPTEWLLLAVAVHVVFWFQIERV